MKQAGETKNSAIAAYPPGSATAWHIFCKGFWHGFALTDADLFQRGKLVPCKILEYDRKNG